MDREVKRLKAMRQVYEQWLAREVLLEGKLAATELAQRLEATRAKVQQAQQIQERLRDRIHGQAKARYAQSGNKHPHPSVEVRVYTDLEYDDQAAIRWCREHEHGDLLTVKLQKRPFAKLVRAVGVGKMGLGFVAEREDPRVFITL